jgi:hypothetical protein
MKPKVREVSAECMRHLDEMADLFKPRCKLTFLMRDPDNQEAEMLLTTDGIDELIKALERAKTREEIIPR